MSAEPALLARNTSYLTLALVAQKVISFLYFTFLARLLGPESIGKYVLALSLTSMFSVLLDLGLAPVLTRETARDENVAKRLTQLIVAFKFVAAAVVVGLVVLTANLLGYPSLTRELVYIACGVMVLDSFILTTYSAIRGFHTLTWESFGTILFQVVLASGGMAVAQVTRDLRAFMFALLLAASVHCIYAVWQLRHRFRISLRPLWEGSAWQPLFRLAWPFALAAILLRIYGYLDTVLLSKLAGDHAVGIYSVAYKVTFALQFIPSAFSASLLPGFSAYFATAKDRLAGTFSRGLIYLTAISVPLSLGAISIAPAAVKAIYPAFSESVVPLQILMASLPFLFATFPVGALLAAGNKQLRQTGNIAIATAVSVILNLILIPRLGPTGASIASLLSTLVLLTLGWSVVRQLVAYDRTFLSGRLARIAGAGLGMALVAWVLVMYIPALLAVVLAGLVYLWLVLMLGGVTLTELRALIQLMLRRITSPV